VKDYADTASFLTACIRSPHHPHDLNGLLTIPAPLVGLCAAAYTEKRRETTRSTPRPHETGKQIPHPSTEITLPMARKSKAKPSRTRPVGCESIPVSMLRDISIHFPGDVYVLAIWTVLSDLAKSTPTSHPYTMLEGLASKFVSMYGINYSRPLTTEAVMEVFHHHGISGNPALFLDEESPESVMASLNTQDLRQPILTLSAR